MVTLVKKKDNSSKNDTNILSIQTRLVQNNPPYTVGNATNINAVGSIKIVGNDGN